MASTEIQSACVLSYQPCSVLTHLLTRTVADLGNQGNLASKWIDAVDLVLNRLGAAACDNHVPGDRVHIAVLTNANKCLKKEGKDGLTEHSAVRNGDACCVSAKPTYSSMHRLTDEGDRVSRVVSADDIEYAARYVRRAETLALELVRKSLKGLDHLRRLCVDLDELDLSWVSVEYAHA